MMYIEHSNLEDNLHQILTNRVPTSSSPSASEATAAVEVSALLARAREALNSASSTLQEHTVETISSNGQLQNHSNNSSAPNNYKKTIIKDLIRRPEPKLLPLVNGNSIDFTKGLHRTPTTAENNISASAKLQNHQQHIGVEEEEEEKDEEQYELLQLIDSNLTTQAENLKILKVEKTPKPKEIYNCAPISRFEADLKDGIQTVFSSATAAAATALSHSQVDEDEEFEYVVTRVPKRKIQSAGSQEFQVNSILNRKLYKPVPEAIPLDTHSRVTRRQPPPLSKLRRHNPNQENNNNKHRKLNGYATVSAFYAEDDDDDNNCGYYSDSETVEAASTDQSAYAFNKDFLSRQETQMGLDILNKLKHLFNWNPSTHDYSTAHQEGNRKRRSNDWSVGESVGGPQQIKYRKVENRFPKYIAACSEDDEVNEYLPPFTHHNQQRKLHKFDKQYLVNNSAQSSRTLLEMSNRPSTSIDKPPLRKSIFSAPHITQQLFKNTNYADVEFSDDDEPYLRKGFNIQPSKLTSVKRVPEVFNIPIIRTGGERLKPIPQQKPPPPPLIEPSTGSILQSSLIPCLETRRKPTYAETLRQTAETGHVLGGRSSNSSSGGVPTSESSRIFNGLILRSNHWPTQNRSSILNQEKASEEREKYQQLLEQVVPRLYGSSGVENKLTSASSSNSASQRRRSALILGTALTSSARSSPTIDIRSKCFGQSTLKRPPLSSTINLDEDVDYDDVTITGVSHLKTLRTSKITQPLSATVILDDDEISDIIDLGNEERHVLSACAKIQKEKNSIINLCEDNKPKREALPFVEPVNSLRERFNASPHIKDNWLQNWQLKWLQRKKNRRDEVTETVKVTEKLTAERRAAEAEIQERLRKFQIVDPELLIIDDFEDAIEEPEFVELTEEYRTRINAALCGPLDQVLISKFNLNITRRDIHTLCGHNWLNDEVINFYMNLLTHRGERKHDSHGLPRVYAMNTFFVPRLMQAGHDGVKRWTRKVDIFGKDIVPVPVHVGGVHWCMAIIHMKNRTIKYYDSMGTPNPNVLKALAQYLKDESMDKRKQPFDTSDFVVESVHGVPRQMNGSDCGVFSCMFAEYITRNRDITFSQQNMEYFRQKMVLEIVMGELLQ